MCKIRKAKIKHFIFFTSQVTFDWVWEYILHSEDNTNMCLSTRPTVITFRIWRKKCLLFRTVWLKSYKSIILRFLVDLCRLLRASSTSSFRKFTKSIMTVNFSLNKGTEMLKDQKLHVDMFDMSLIDILKRYWQHIWPHIYPFESLVSIDASKRRPV